MKAKLVIIFFSILFFRSFSQQPGQLTLSGRVGVGQSLIQSMNRGFSTSSSRLSISAGLLTNYWVSENVSLETGFILMSKGGEIKSISVPQYTHRYELLYGEIPITPKYTWTYKRLKFHTYVGPAASILFSSRDYVDNDLNDPRTAQDGAPVQDVSKAELSVIYGVGLNSFFLKKGNFFADLRFGEDVTPFTTLGNDRLYNHYYSVSAGYIFK